MLKKTILYTLCSLFISYLSARPEKPNVILILTDDFGWQDVKCYDIDKPSPYETPHIDQLSKEGVLFWEGYSPAPTCSPSRGAILAGKHPARLQRTHVEGGKPPMPHNEKHFPMVSPWRKGRLDTAEITIAEALKGNGYTTGHVGKWHLSIQHRAYPHATDQGFDYGRSDIGITRPMKPHRLTNFATTDKADPYHLDENGFPYDQNSEDALTFLRENKDKPFFLYYATWLVHTPIHSRSKALLEKYCKKLGIPYPTDPSVWNIQGQHNPYYAAMVEMLDYYIGQLISYLKNTEDPRWKGHQLIENTYIIFSSDNGGMERVPGEQITDNYPLDKGKINAKEGGVRVPLIIAGPNIPKDVQSNVMINGLDFYPTILSWTHTQRPKAQQLDGANLATLLTQNPKDATLVIDPYTSDVRNTMIWHFPNSVAMQSTIRVGNYKLIRNLNVLANEPLQLYQLYDDEGNRKDIEEMKNLSSTMPQKTKMMNDMLQERLDEMDAEPAYCNPFCTKKIPQQDKVPSIDSHGKNGNDVWLSFRENEAKVIKADLIYTLNGGDKVEEWFRIKADIKGNKVIAQLPEGTTHYVFNLIDNNNFLLSYPRMGDKNDYTNHSRISKALSNIE